MFSVKEVAGDKLAYGRYGSAKAPKDGIAIGKADDLGAVAPKALLWLYNKTKDKPAARYSSRAALNRLAFEALKTLVVDSDPEPYVNGNVRRPRELRYTAGKGSPPRKGSKSDQLLVALHKGTYLDELQTTFKMSSAYARRYLLYLAKNHGVTIVGIRKEARLWLTLEAA